MTIQNQQYEHALTVMTLDIVKDVLNQPDNLPEVVSQLLARTRELSGARTIIMAQCHQGTSGKYVHRLLGVNPERRRALAESPEIERLIEIIHNLPEPALWRSEERGGEAESILTRLGYGLSLALPLRAGVVYVGAILMLGLIDDHHLTSIVKMQETLSGIVALVLRNSFLIEKQKHVIAERERAEAELRTHREHLEDLVTARTSELKAANKDLRHEISQREQAEAQLKVLLDDLERANLELQDFAYIVSHDLKAPLRGISSLAKWLHKDYADLLDEKGRRYLNQMLARTKRMHHFIEGILHYSRLGRVDITPEPLETDALVRRVITAISPPENITVSIAGTLPAVMYDKTLFYQLFQNLLDNAVKHLGKPEGNVIVSCSDRGKSWEFAVQDTGVGIEARHFERIFKIFQSLKPQHEAESTGIGLALVKKIVTRHGGTVWVESTVGEGSTFLFSIPKTQKTERIETRYTVLIIDANPDFAEVVVKMLERAGHTALYAPDRQTADDVCATYAGDIRIALIDMHIAGEEPLEWPTILRTRRPAIKIIITTGKDISDADVFLTKEDVDGVLTTPFTIKELNRIVD